MMFRLDSEFRQAKAKKLSPPFSYLNLWVPEMYGHYLDNLLITYLLWLGDRHGRKAVVAAAAKVKEIWNQSPDWPSNITFDIPTLREAPNDALFQTIKELCDYNGYGRILQLANAIVELTDHPEKTEDYKKLYEERMSRVEETLRSIRQNPPNKEAEIFKNKMSKIEELLRFRRRSSHNKIYQDRINTIGELLRLRRRSSHNKIYQDRINTIGELLRLRRKIR